MISSPRTIEGLAERLRSPAFPSTLSSYGHVRNLVGLLVESIGPIASLGDLVAIESNRCSDTPRFAEVVGFRENRVLLSPLDGADGIRGGDRVVLVREGFRVPVGPSLLGRVVDGLMRPLDRKPPPPRCRWQPVQGKPPDALHRPRITTQLETGIRSIDAVLPCGRGQRVGILAGSGVGKSSLLGMICRHASASVNVIALIGERGKEVREFVEESLGEQGLRKSVVVVVTSDRPALQRIKGAEAAMSIAEYFRDAGQDVLFVMDSVTRYAMAQREVGLAAGEPPTTRGYPPSVYRLLPRLLERAGTSERGSITGFFTVLVEGDDLHDPIGDTVRGILDGQIVLSRELAGEGHYPAIDIHHSVSRVFHHVTTESQRRLAQQLRSTLAVYRRAKDMIAIGAYQSGNDPEIDRAVALRPALDAFLRQGLEEHTSLAQVQAALNRVFGG
jgi:flagellum-specific ATP synthase